MRKIIQIATAFYPEDSAFGDGYVFINAVCDDGSLWGYNGEWTRLPDIPQDTERNC